jgi:hypothetical protein
MKQKIFISYSHKDVELVTAFAQRLSLCGFDLWIDEKDVEIGSNYTSQIFGGIYDSDVYMVFISKSSLNSVWVNAEIDFALTRKIEGGRLQLIPVRLDDSEMPVALRNIDFLDARFSVNDAVKQFTDKFDTDKKSELPDHIRMATIGFSISKNTDVEVGPFNEGLTVNDLDQSRTQLLESLRKKAYGILMNFVSIADFDFMAAVPKFMNGIYTENVSKVRGSTSGSICENVSIQTTVFNPDESKVYRLLNERLDILDINEITFGFIVPSQDGERMPDIGRGCLQKLQDKYIILSYDNIEGAKVELEEDFYLCLSITEELLKIKLSAKYAFELTSKMKAFSVTEFLRTLLQK